MLGKPPVTESGISNVAGINIRNKRKRSHVGIVLVRLLASQGVRIFSTQRARELSSRVGLKKAYLLEALYHLRQNGWIVPLRRGLYALSPSVPGVSPAHEFEIAMALVDPVALATGRLYTITVSPNKSHDRSLC